MLSIRNIREFEQALDDAWVMHDTRLGDENENEVDRLAAGPHGV